MESDSDDNVNRHDSDSGEEFDGIDTFFSPDIGDRSSSSEGWDSDHDNNSSGNELDDENRGQKGGGGVGVCHEDMKLDEDGK